MSDSTSTLVSAALLFVALSLTPLVADAAPPTLNFFCTSNAPQSKVFYLTETFTATAEVRDVNNAWQTYIAGKDAAAKAGAVCQAGLDLPSLEALRKVTRDSIASTAQDVVGVDWKYASI